MYVCMEFLAYSLIINDDLLVLVYELKALVSGISRAFKFLRSGNPASTDKHPIIKHGNWQVSIIVIQGKRVKKDYFSPT